MAEPLLVSLDKLVIDNEFYRNVHWTGKHLQLVLMMLKPHDTIEWEVHDVDQFFYIVEGEAVIQTNDKSTALYPHDAAIIPAGTLHGVYASKHGAKLFTIYTPPEHPAGKRVHDS
jgi:mannose-6-phosphate isomerase-like protein (cupin superfamily)